MTAIISIKHPDPRFEGQTKTKLDNPDAAKAVGKVAGDEIVLYFDRNLDVLKTVLSSAEKAAKIRKTENSQTARAEIRKSARYLLLREIRREVRQKRPETETFRRFFLFAGKY